MVNSLTSIKVKFRKKQGINNYLDVYCCPTINKIRRSKSYFKIIYVQNEKKILKYCL